MNGAHSLDVHFPDKALAVTYNNLLPVGYTPLEVVIRASLKQGGLPPIPNDVINHFTESFNAQNAINKSFYPESCINPLLFEGAADFTVLRRKNLAVGQ